MIATAVGGAGKQQEEATRSGCRSEIKKQRKLVLPSALGEGEAISFFKLYFS
jgi:hypothetical protein